MTGSSVFGFAASSCFASSIACSTTSAEGKGWFSLGFVASSLARAWVEKYKAEAINQGSIDFASVYFIYFILNCIIGGVVIVTGDSTDARSPGSAQDNKKPVEGLTSKIGR
jgi:hypothetical protein